MKKYIFFTLLFVSAFIHGGDSDQVVIQQWNNFVAKTKDTLSQDKDYFTGITTNRVWRPAKNPKKKSFSKSTVKKTYFGVYLRGEAKLELVTRKEAQVEEILTPISSYKQTL